MLKRTTLIFLYIILPLCMLTSPLPASATPRAVIKKQSLPFARKLCRKNAVAYFGSNNKKSIIRYCNKIIRVAKPSIYHCIDNTSVLDIHTSKFVNCLNKRLRQNKKFIRQLHSSVITICVNKTLQKHPDYDRKELTSLCRKTAPTTINHIIRNMLR